MNWSRLTLISYKALTKSLWLYFFPLNIVNIALSSVVIIQELVIDMAIVSVTSSCHAKLSYACRCQTKVQWVQVVFNVSKPAWIVWAGQSCICSLQEGPKWKSGDDPAGGQRDWDDQKEKTMATNGVGQSWLFSTRTNLIIGNKIWPMDIQDVPEAPYIQCVILLE